MEKPKRIIACPRCGKKTVYSARNKWRPFCSERCKMTDLGLWASEGYRVPGDSSPKPDEGKD